MLERLSPRRSVFLQLVTGSIAVLIAIAVFAIITTSYFLHEVDEANERRWLAGGIANQLLQLRLNEKDFLLRDAEESAFYQTGHAPSLQQHQASMELVNAWIDSLANLSKGDLSIKRLHGHVNTYGVSFNKLVSEVRAQGSANIEVMHDTTYNRSLNEIYNSVSVMEPVLASVMSNAVHDSDVARRRLALAAIIILLFGIALAVGFFYIFAANLSRMTLALESTANDIGQGKFNSRVRFNSENELGRLAVAFNRMSDNLAALVGAVRDSSSQINSSTMEIAATSKQQQATAAEIAATTNEVGSTAKEISSTSQELANTVKQVALVAEETAELAAEGQTGLTRLDTTIREVSEASGMVNERLTVLREKAETITSVVTTIIKVADQTNLLSLNAAIEAEKAGEYGRGFAVVATEIRRLADQTAVATANIEQIIKEMQSAVTASVMSMDQFSDRVRRGVETGDKVGAQLSEIIRKVQALAPHLEAVDSGMESQSKGAHMISESLSQLSASVQQTAESLAQSSRAIEQLNNVAQSLQAGVSRFSTSIA